jgi:hypothetical protein
MCVLVITSDEILCVNYIIMLRTIIPPSVCVDYELCSATMKIVINGNHFV